MTDYVDQCWFTSQLQSSTTIYLGPTRLLPMIEFPPRRDFTDCYRHCVLLGTKLTGESQVGIRFVWAVFKIWQRNWSGIGLTRGFATLSESSKTAQWVSRIYTVITPIYSWHSAVGVHLRLSPFWSYKLKITYHSF